MTLDYKSYRPFSPVLEQGEKSNGKLYVIISGNVFVVKQDEEPIRKRQPFQ